MIYLGIDPGKSGGIAWVIENPTEPIGEYMFSPVPIVAHMKFDGLTPADVWAIFDGELCHRRGEIRAVIEKVGATPQMGVTSAFTFGSNFGFWIGVLAAAKISHSLVTPQKWQKAMGCLSKGDKNVTKAAAQRLYPNEKITHATADALLLATYCRRHHQELF